MFNQLVRNLIQLLFPDKPEYFPVDTHFQPRHFSGVTCILPYKERIVQQTIKENKYHRNENAAQSLANTLDRFVSKYESEQVYIIPIPQSYKRWRERGFDHLQEIVMRCTYNDRLCTHILRKAIHTKRQAHVNKQDRLTQQVGTFACDAKLASQLRGTVILFDDVLTTGATMKAARAALSPHLSTDTNIVCLTLAH